ncbi:hypothetical protein [Rhizobium sp. 1399]|uniref:hypothetical protein n=1 Tax=Rhizobium sp. 1399 TaxID=2817758 RepID=UPI002856F31B|nr:hypothetical protein [Rhizobium sp. 1399]MDR6664034.1 hypothetical protein [Rhizobium sp. 1399]
MAVTPEIKTRFTLDGLRSAATGLRAFGKTVSDTLSDARRRGSVVFGPLDKSLSLVERHAKTAAKEVAKVGGATAFHGLRLGALGAGAAIAGLTLKFTALSKVATDSAKETAASLKQIGLDADKIGATPQDVNVLGFAGERAGVDRDEIINQISTISNEFLTVRDNIGKANAAYQTFLGIQAKQAALGARVGGAAGFGSVLAGFSEADIQARSQSITAIEARLKQIDEYQNRITVDRPQYGGIDPDTLSQAGNLALDRERQQLLAAQSQYKQGLSPQGQALSELQGFGIDFDRASKGGVDGLVAISEAFQRIQDPSQKARIAMRLFGEDAGVKMIPLLNGGKRAIDEYRETLKRLGGEVTTEDIEKAKSYQNAVQDMQTAIGGVRLEIARNLLPYLTETSVQLTNWFVKSRVAIAKYVSGAFLDLRAFATDVISIFGGDTSNIQTKWLDSLIKKTVVVREIWSDAVKQISLLWEGKDSDYPWLNKLRDGFVEVKKFAVDAWAVVTGGDAKNFQWLNSARDQIVAFAGRLSDAFGMLKDLLGTVRDFFKPVFDYLGKDVVTFGLFLGLTRMLGLFGTLMTAAGVFAKALGAVFSLGGGAIAAGRAVAGVGSAAGAVAATATGLTASITAIGTAISTVVAGAAVLGVALAGAFYAGQKAAEFMLKDTEKAYETVWAAQAKLMAAQGDAALYERLGMRDDSARTKGAQRLVYEKQMGIKAPDPTYYMTAAEKQQYSRELQNSWMGWDKNYDGGDLGALARESEARRGVVSKRVAVDINVNGRPTTLYGDDVSSTQLTRDLEYANRSY